VALSDRLDRLEENHGPKLCEDRYCMQLPTYVEVIHYPDGSEERMGSEPPSLCQTCPDRLGEGSRRIRVVEVHRRLDADLG
jgi:hypothetical protein